MQPQKAVEGLVKCTIRYLGLGHMDNEGGLKEWVCLV